MCGRYAYTSLVQLLNPRLRYVGNDKNLFATDAFWDIYALVTHNIKLSRGRQMDKFPTYPMPEFYVGDRVLVRNQTRDKWNLKYDIADCVVHVMGKHLELMDESGKTCKVNAQKY